MSVDELIFGPSNIVDLSEGQLIKDCNVGVVYAGPNPDNPCLMSLEFCADYRDGSYYMKLNMVGAKYIQEVCEYMGVKTNNGFENMPVEVVHTDTWDVVGIRKI